MGNSYLSFGGTIRDANGVLSFSFAGLAGLEDASWVEVATNKEHLKFFINSFVGPLMVEGYSRNIVLWAANISKHSRRLACIVLELMSCIQFINEGTCYCSLRWFFQALKDEIQMLLYCTVRHVKGPCGWKSSWRIDLYFLGLINFIDCYIFFFLNGRLLRSLH